MKNIMSKIQFGGLGGGGFVVSVSVVVELIILVEKVMDDLNSPRYIKRSLIVEFNSTLKL